MIFMRELSHLSGSRACRAVRFDEFLQEFTFLQFSPSFGMVVPPAVWSLTASVESSITEIIAQTRHVQRLPFPTCPCTKPYSDYRSVPQRPFLTLKRCASDCPPVQHPSTYGKGKALYIATTSLLLNTSHVEALQM